MRLHVRSVSLETGRFLPHRHDETALPQTYGLPCVGAVVVHVAEVDDAAAGAVVPWSQITRLIDEAKQ